ncbi:tigger transposable element-derived protein 4-like [Aphis craccivora]|uniref:Tigger transposable element-derived protein 4-like n=1 Tax=Aphis craccivora TaxID=307492 RepID=A0A6G0VRJ4_APHCR|nr:tigger transposable element-derived protein 4-like [Aphis craccivora]
MNFIEFRKISHLCKNHSDYGFMVIDKTPKMNEGRYRCGFHTFIKIK